MAQAAKPGPAAGAQSSPPAAQAKTDNDTKPAAKADSDSRVAELEAEVKELREQLAAAGRQVKAGRQPTEPSFQFTESMVTDLETTGRTTSPFTGRHYVGSGRGDAREASLNEFLAAKPPAKKR